MKKGFYGEGLNEVYISNGLVAVKCENPLCAFRSETPEKLFKSTETYCMVCNRRGLQFHDIQMQQGSIEMGYLMVLFLVAKGEYFLKELANNKVFLDCLTWLTYVPLKKYNKITPFDDLDQDHKNELLYEAKTLSKNQDEKYLRKVAKAIHVLGTLIDVHHKEAMYNISVKYAHHYSSETISKFLNDTTAANN